MAQQEPNSRAAILNSPTKSPRHLLDLPTELLVQTFYWVLEDTEKKKKPPYHLYDWLRLGRTCKRFHLIVQPCLYQNIIAGDNGNPYEHQRRINLDKLVCLLYSMIF
jgi:hypothetical protein